MFRHVEVVAPFSENSWLIGCFETGAAALVDPGGHVRELLAVAGQQGSIRAAATSHEGVVRHHGEHDVLPRPILARLRVCKSTPR